MARMQGGGTDAAGGYSGTGSRVGAVNGSQNIPVKATPALAVLYTFTMVFAANSVPQPFPGFRIPDGCSVRIRANNGTTAGNQHIAFAGINREQLLNGHAAALAPLDDIAFPIDNLAKAWGMGTIGEGLIATVFSTGFSNS